MITDTSPRITGLTDLADVVLEYLATREDDGGDLPEQVLQYASPDLTPEGIAFAWADVQVAIRNRDGLAGGTLHWSEVFGAGDVGTRDCQSVAIQLSTEAADNAMNTLRYGRGL